MSGGMMSAHRRCLANTGVAVEAEVAAELPLLSASWPTGLAETLARTGLYHGIGGEGPVASVCLRRRIIQPHLTEFARAISVFASWPAMRVVGVRWSEFGHHPAPVNSRGLLGLQEAMS